MFGSRSTQASSTASRSRMPIEAISVLARSIRPSSDRFQISSVRLQKYSSPIQTLPGSATMWGLQLLKICMRPTCTPGSWM